MPRLSTSPRVKTRIRTLLKKLLEYVDPRTESEEYPTDVFEYRWIDETTLHPKLVIKTKLSFLAELIESESKVPVSKGHIREVLLVLQKKLNLLEDNRIKTQGSDIWDFTLKLWHTSASRNLSKFEQAWEQYKTSQGKGSTARSNPGLNPKFILAAQQNRPYPLHNLTLRPDSYFIETQSVLSDLLSILAEPNANAIVSIVGPGGIGKTTLALETAHRCLAAAKQGKADTSNPAKKADTTGQVPTFDVIVFASAQPKEFLGPHLSERWQTDRTLKDIIREILRTLDCAEGSPFQIEAQIEYVHNVLKGYKALLILDNLETVENPSKLLAFVRTLPPTIKVILTSRTRFGVGKTIALDYLSAEHGFSLIAYQARQKLVSLEFSRIQEIYRLSGGLPLAMAYSVGYLSVHKELPVLRRSHTHQNPSEIVQYCVEAPLKQLQNQSAHSLLMAATLFTEKFSIKAAAHVANLADELSDIDQEFYHLHRLSLISKLDSIYYSMHAFTQDFVRAKLDRDLAFKESAQQRWISWYIALVTPFAENWFDWQDYSELDREWGNIRALVNWCLRVEDYKTLQQLWQGLRGYTLFRGYWDERQEWMDGLISMAKKKGENTVLAQALFYKGQTLVHIDETDAKKSALPLLQEAWEMGAQLDPDVSFGVLNYVTAIHLKQNHFEEAKRWLNKKRSLPKAHTVSRERQQYMHYYYTAELALRQKQHQVAEDAYRKALQIAEVRKWKKPTAYSKGWLAITLIQKGELDEAEHLLKGSVEAAQDHKDKRSIAKCYAHLALLAEQREQKDQFIDWTTLAKNEFEQLGMASEANQMQQWLEAKRSHHEE